MRRERRSWSVWLRVPLIALLAASVGCFGGGGGGGGSSTGGSSSTPPTITGDGSLTGVASLTGSNQAAAVRSTGLAGLSAGQLSASITTLDGQPIKDVQTGGDGAFTCDGLPLGRPLRIVIKTGGAKMFTFFEVPKDSKAAQQVRVDPVATLIFHRIVKIFRERSLKPGDLGSVNPAALAAQVRQALEGVREDLAFRLEVALDKLSDDPDACVALFEQLVPRAVLEATGDALGVAEADADIEAGQPTALLVAVARRMLHTRAALLISMQPGSSDPTIIAWVQSLPPELRFDPQKADGTPWSGSGPVIIKVPFLEPDRNGGGGDERPLLDGPVFDDARLGALAQAMKNGKTRSLAELHQVIFGPPAEGGAGFVLVGFGQFGPEPLPYVYIADSLSRVVPRPPPDRPPDWRAAGAAAPPFPRTFGAFVGKLPSLEELRLRFFNRRVHIPFNPSGPPREFVVAKSDLFWRTQGGQADPVRVDLTIVRDPAGKITRVDVAESVTGAYFLGLTERTPGPDGALRFLDARSLRPLRTPDGKPLLGVRPGFADLARGAVELPGLHDRYSLNEATVFGGPPFLLNGMPFPVIFDKAVGGKPVLVEGPRLLTDGTWSTTATFSLAPTDGSTPTDAARFLLGINETCFPYNITATAALLIEARGGVVVGGPGGPTKIQLSRIESEISLTLHGTVKRLPGCAIPNPRYDPLLDPFADDLNNNGIADPGEPSFPFRPFIPPDILLNFDAALGQPGYLSGPRAYGIDPVIYSLPDGAPFSPGQPPPGFRLDRSPKDNGLRLRKFRARANGFLHGRPQLLFAQLLASFPKEFFDGEHEITPDTRLDVFQCLALARLRIDMPEIVADAKIDVDPGPNEQIHTVPFLGFSVMPGAPDPQLMERIVSGLTR